MLAFINVQYLLFSILSFLFRIGTSEKGYCTVKLTVNTEPGHSSMPEKQSSIGVLSHAITK